MATTVRIDEADLPQLVERARAGEEIILAQGETPVVRLVPVAATSTAALPDVSPEQIEEMRERRKRAAGMFAEDATPKRPDLFGLYAGQITIGPEFFEPLPEEELRLWEGRGDDKA